MAESYCKNLKKILFHPKKFFDSVEKDKDYSKIIFFYVKIVTIATIISFILSIILLSVQNKLTLSSVVSLLTSSLFNIGFAFLMPFVIAAILHLGILIFGGKQGYFNTYKPVTYSLAIVAVYGILSTIIITIITITNPVSITQEQIIANPELIFQEGGFVASLVVSMIILVISLIHSLVVQVIGVSRFQKVSKLRAFFGLILIPVVLAIISAFLLKYYINDLLATTQLT